VSQVGLARPLELGIREFVEEDVGLAVEDAVALLNDGEADRLREVALAGARATEEEPVLPLGDEAAGGELEDEGAVPLLVEVEIEGVQGLAGIAEAGVLDPALEQPVLASSSSWTRVERKSIGASFSAWAWRSRPSRPAAMPEQRS